ncbi:beta-1,3-galactosyltransferase 1-like [Mizuhopecten yessoensis]|uniref:Hexosyltransferase n=1 Tax=Mizuhopecten yessoensis TaxID=6573 RepID=A0A210PZV3_MIZYE|nr:beta-1,3-galactosyltransferase 1-like [Mizuhopecten yessoensis]XP_021371033.1 beta-1,3-galactosyltransferase 1-like [Mizuhopecten yessoensis]XP_021371034.1 beta-1,3-galactosyltransferase 1-like [Mizuhopecten yessoensis]XP_021371035.1 beta-1,3-galactosyltransferase 1-like [Mizuhopecten yessoensis]OWF42017.1 Beta-1,3-galactosyltransferase 1 [Mizuhopecten yessoensis]
MFPRLPTVYRFLCILVVLSVILYTFLVQRATKTAVSSFKPSWQELIVSNSKIDNVELIPRKPEASTFNRPHVQKKQTTDWVVVNTTPAKTNDDGVVNPHRFTYLLNPDGICKDNVYLIIYVHTAPPNFHKRQMLRQTWGQKAILNQYRSKMVFVMGAVADNRVMEKVKMEHAHYGDIVQEDFVDSYRNLTHKGIAALNWVSSYCYNATYALKTDDDIMVNIFKLVSKLTSDIENRLGKTDLILCNQWLRMKVLRDKKSKWYIPKEDFEPNYFPAYCSGSAFILSIDVIRRMSAVAKYVPFFWVDDYYITGMLAKKVGVTQKRLNEAYILNGKVVVDRFKNDTDNKLLFFHVGKQNTIYSMWDILKERMRVKTDNFTWKPGS